MDNALIECQGLTRSFGSLMALDHVDLQLPVGKIIGLLGPNGSGKTTLMKILNGLLQPGEGTVRIGGYAPGVETKKIISYLPDKSYFASWMQVRDMMNLFSDFYEDFDRAKAEDMCRMLGLEGKAKIKNLSKGTREKVQLMLVMSRKAKLYLLDEPIAGVDPAAREFILQTILRNYSEDATLLIATHLLSDVEQVLDEAIFLKDGKVILCDAVDTIREREGKSLDEVFRDMFREYMWQGGDSHVR